MIECLRDYKDGAQYKGVVYKADDVVVADGEVGNIVAMDFDKEVCKLEVSIPLEDIEDPEYANSDTKCTMVGMRKATKAEAAAYEFFLRARLNNATKDLMC